MEYIHSGYQSGMLTGHAIDEAVHSGKIIIDPYDAKQLNPNSYNLRLSSSYKTIDTAKLPILANNILNQRYPKNYYYIETTKPVEYETVEIGSDGVILLPDHLYLIASLETIGSEYYIPILTGRSSAGRLGIQVHSEAGFGDLGYIGKWTFQIKVTYPTKIYAGMTIGQIYFITPKGVIDQFYSGKYVNSEQAEGSKIYMDFE